MKRVPLVILLGGALVSVAMGAGLVYAVQRDVPARPARSRSALRSATTRVPAVVPSKPVPTTTTTTPRSPELGSGQAVTFAFGGDVHFEGVLRTKLNADPSTVLAPIKPVLSGADVAMVNLETAITDRGAPEAKEFQFRAPGAAFIALRDAGVDVTTMANNHGRDYGAVGFDDTLAASAFTGFPVVGVGHNAAEAYAPYRLTAKGQRIAIIGATDVIDNNLVASWTATDSQPGLASAKLLDRLVAAVQAARADADTVVVYLHWGVEGITCPSPRQQELARALTAAGADIVVGSHAHRQEGAGRLGIALVDYGLGNFAFYNEAGPSGVSGVLQVTMTGHRVDAYGWLPARISGGVPQPLAGPAADAALASWNDLRPCSGLAP